MPARICRLSILLIVVLAALRAQEHRPLIGRVVDKELHPLVGATVTAAWNESGSSLFASASTATAESDARGYFRVPVPPGVPLRVWAIGKPDADGSAWVTARRPCALGEARLELLAEERRRPVPATITGLEPWAAFAPFRLRSHVCPETNLVHEVPLGDDGKAVLPIEPPGFAFLELVTKGGESLMVWSGSARERAVPPPQPLPVEVVDDQGKPVAEAQILQRVGEIAEWSRWSSTRRARWRVVGTTDAAGQAVAMLPLAEAPLAAEKPRDLVLLARKSGCRDTHSGFDEKWFVDGKQLGDGEKPTALRFTLKAAPVLAGKFSVPGTALPTRLGVRWISKIAFQNGWTHLPRCEVVPVAADGAFALPLLPEDAYEITFLCEPARIAVGEGAAPVRVPVALPMFDQQPTEEIDLGGRDLPVTTFQVVAPDSTPLGAVDLLVCQANGGSLETDPPAIRARADRVGRVAAVLPRSPTHVLAIGEQGYAFAVVTPATTGAVELRLQPFPQLRGRVVDDTGAAVRGARVRLCETQRRGGGGTDDEAKALDAVSTVAGQEFLGDVRSDENGEFVLRFLPRPGLTMRAQASLESRESERFAIEESTEVLTVTLK